MITILNSKSIYIGTDLKKFNELRDYLASNNIDYKYKVRDRATGHGTLCSHTGSAGIPSNAMYEYEILIHKNDYNKIQLK